MSPRDWTALAALNRQGDAIAEVFTAAGYRPIAPDILQPADVFLDRYGEEIRGRTYVFTAPDGAELCLRPDLTIPACRYHLALDPQASGEARYCYAGPAFRFQAGGETGARPREFGQAGVEFFGGADAEAADAEVLGLGDQALRAAGLGTFSIHIGDLGLFAALVDGIAMPDRWRRKLKQRFWRPRAFRSLLARLSGQELAARNDGHEALLADIRGLDRTAAVAVVDRLLGERDIPLVGGRGLDEIAGRLLEQAADADEVDLPDETVATISAYLATEGHPREARDRIAALVGPDAPAMHRALGAFSRRLDLIEEAGIRLDDCLFSAEFGRNLEYYTGFVFQFEVPGGGPGSQVAGGGRYDNMLADLGAPDRVPAVGLAIHTERLLVAVAADGPR
jgi:ATP phosphoribosyltransferase regulatory subunit